MGRIFQPLLFMLARCTRNELIRQIEFLKAENEMLRTRVPRQKIALTPLERDRLLKLGAAIGPPVRRLITIVSYHTYLRWRRKVANQPRRWRLGRPKTPQEIQDLVLKIARETGWGYTRILGELKKLGIMSVCRQTVVNTLKAHGLEPGPRRGPGTWDELLKAHAETLWQCDFFSKRLLTRLRIRQVCTMVFINVATRRVYVSNCTCSPTAAWVADQTAAFLDHAQQHDLPISMVTRDNDVLFRGFDKTLTARGVKSKRLAYRAPNTNAFVERFIQSLQVECLDHFLVFGEKHLDYLVKEYVEHYHVERPHQGLGNLRIGERAPPAGETNWDLGSVERRTRLGGLLSHYERVAA